MHVETPVAGSTAGTAARPDAGGGFAAHRLDLTTPIDRSRWFVCPTLTPLYYTAVYGDLTERQRRRYNQLFGIYANALIAYCERSFGAALEAAAGALGSRDGDGVLALQLRRFARDERHHEDMWRRLNRLSGEPAGGLLALPRSGSGGGPIGFVVRRPALFPAVFWLMLALEERSVEFSRRSARLDPDRIEPRYRQAYRGHLGDEVRHVRLDCRLIERFYAGRSAGLRRINAALFARVLGQHFLAPGRSAAGIYRRLAEEFPELEPRLLQMVRQSDALGGDPDYQSMMYSRESTPILFGMLDRFPEMRAVQDVLPCYHPPLVGSGRA